MTEDRSHAIARVNNVPAASIALGFHAQPLMTAYGLRLTKLMTDG